MRHSHGPRGRQGCPGCNPVSEYRACAADPETDITYALDCTFAAPHGDTGAHRGARIALASAAIHAIHGIEGDWISEDDSGVCYVITVGDRPMYLEALPDTRDALASIPWHPGHEPKARRVSPLHLGGDS